MNKIEVKIRRNERVAIACSRIVHERNSSDDRLTGILVQRLQNRIERWA